MIHIRNSKAYANLAVVFIIVIIFSFILFFYDSEPVVSSGPSEGGEGGHEPCFLPNVLIRLSDGSYTKISEIKVGDSIVGFDDNGNLVTNKVEALVRSQSDNYFILKTTSQEVKVTGMHPFYVGEGKYKKVVELNPRDTVYVLVDGKLVKDKILSKERIDEKVDVYNLQVTGTNNYFANSFAVHNKGGEGRTTTTTTIVQFCGDGTVNNGEQCELPNTNDNDYCSQTTSTCSGNQIGTRDSLGNCNSACQCVNDTFTYSCVKNSCGAQCAVNSDCPNKCVGSVRKFNGQCDSSSCACTYQTENCNNQDGWYNTSEFRTITDVCIEKEQQKQEYRNYGCSPDECTYTVTKYQWVDTGVVTDLPSSTPCGTNTTSCPGGFCSLLFFNGWIFSPCTRFCDGSGNCGICNSCSFTSQECTSSGCCDATCNSLLGCGFFRDNSNCQSYCLGNTRFFSGICGNSCSCSYTNQNCDNLDGWYDTKDKRRIICEDNRCQYCDQKKQEYRDYFCDPSGCTYTVTDTKWVTTKTKDFLCCQGGVVLKFEKQDPCPNLPIKAEIKGVKGCTGDTAYLKENDCDGKTIGTCTLGSTGCSIKFQMTEVGNHTMAACVDTNEDGDFTDAGEQFTTNLEVNCHACNQKQCGKGDYCSTWCETCGGVNVSHLSCLQKQFASSKPPKATAKAGPNCFSSYFFNCSVTLTLSPGISTVLGEPK